MSEFNKYIGLDVHKATIAVSIADGEGGDVRFFGEIEKAVSLAVSLPKTYQNGKNLVIYSMSSVKGENVRSISSEIHAKIISELQKENKTRGAGAQ